MARRLGSWWPRGEEEHAQYRRAAENGAVAKIPPWDRAVATTRRRWAGQVGRLCHAELWRWAARVALWRGAWSRHSVRAIHHTDSDRGRMRLGRGHREVGKQRWDEPVQRHVTDAGMEITWYENASDRIV